jgi:hypothetical protein
MDCAMKSMLFAFSFLLATVPACGGSKESYNDLLVGMNKFKDAMCACTDAACAKKTQDDFGAWAVAHQSTIESAKPSDRQQAEMKPLEDEYKACQARAKGE